MANKSKTFSSLEGSEKYSFSGTDMVAVATINTPDKESVVFGNLAAISYSIYRAKFPVLSMGRITPKGFTRGLRTITGTLVFMDFDESIVVRTMKSLAAEGYKILMDEMPMFDITITMANEFGVKSKIVLYGVTTMTEGKQLSVDQLAQQNVYEFYALDITPLTNVDKNPKDKQIEANLTKPVSLEPPPEPPVELIGPGDISKFRAKIIKDDLFVSFNAAQPGDGPIVKYMVYFFPASQKTMPSETYFEQLGNPTPITSTKPKETWKKGDYYRYVIIIEDANGLTNRNEGFGQIEQNDENQYPPAPTNLKIVKEISGGNIAVSWKMDEKKVKATSYEVYVNDTLKKTVSQKEYLEKNKNGIEIDIEYPHSLNEIHVVALHENEEGFVYKSGPSNTITYQKERITPKPPEKLSVAIFPRKDIYGQLQSIEMNWNFNDAKGLENDGERYLLKTYFVDFYNKTTVEVGDGIYIDANGVKNKNPKHSGYMKDLKTVRDRWKKGTALSFKFEVYFEKDGILSRPPAKYENTQHAR